MADNPDGDQSSDATEQFENLSLIDLNENEEYNLELNQDIVNNNHINKNGKVNNGHHKDISNDNNQSIGKNKEIIQNQQEEYYDFKLNDLKQDFKAAVTKITAKTKNKKVYVD